MSLLQCYTTCGKGVLTIVSNIAKKKQKYSLQIGMIQWLNQIRIRNFKIERDFCYEWLRIKQAF